MEAYIVLGIVAAAIWWVSREARIVFGQSPHDDIDFLEGSNYFDGDDSGYNPATGLQMTAGIDVAGNPLGCDSSGCGSFDSF